MIWLQFTSWRFLLFSPPLVCSPPATLDSCYSWHFRHVSTQDLSSACSSFHQISTWHGPSPPLSLFLCEHIEVFLDDLKLQPFYLNIPSLFPCFLSLPSVFYLQYMMFFLSPSQNVNFMNSFWASWSLLYFQCLEKWLILSTYSIKFSYLSTASHDCLLSCKLLITWNILF